jgi:hypothetical protein
MSGLGSDERRPANRYISTKWIIAGGVALVVVLAAIAVTVVLIDRSHDRARRAAEEAATSASAVASPYDLTERPSETNLAEIKNAAFVSILVPNKAGKLTSYGVDSDLQVAQTLAKAIESAEEVTPDVAATLDGSTDTPGVTTTITFVFSSRETLTFTLDLDHGLIGRGAQVWRPDGDLKALVAAAITSPQP